MRCWLVVEEEERKEKKCSVKLLGSTSEDRPFIRHTS